MKVKVIRRQKLTECINAECIHSIIPVRGHFGQVSLAIALKSPERIGMYDSRLNSPEYSGMGGGVYFIPLDNFTYHPCMHAAIPVELYNHITILEKEWENGMRFIRAKINKPVTF